MPERKELELECVSLDQIAPMRHVASI